MKNFDIIYIILSWIAVTDDSVEFAISPLKELYGDIFEEIPYKRIRKAAKKAVNRIKGKSLCDDDIQAIETHFLAKLELAYGCDGATKRFEDRVYVFKQGKWQFDRTE